MRRLIVLTIAVVLVLTFAVPAVVAQAQGASDCGQWFGEFHKSLATSGMTGQGPERGGHVPGSHHGAAGLCLGH